MNELRFQCIVAVIFISIVYVKEKQNAEVSNSPSELFSNLASGLELIFVRHGESTMNKPIYKFDGETIKGLCRKEETRENIPDGVCNNNRNMRAWWITTNLESSMNESSENLAYLIPLAEEFLRVREKFDAPLTAKGLEHARKFSQQTKSLQLQWNTEQQEHASKGHATVLVSSNLIRAVDTMLNSFSHLVNASFPIYLHSALQEYAKSGNGDCISLFLPKGLEKGKDASASQLWKGVSELRLGNYEEAGMSDVPWAAKSDHDMGWWHRQNMTLANAKESRTDVLINHAAWLPNSHVHRDVVSNWQVPDIDGVKTVRVESEDQYREFLAWSHRLRSKSESLKRMIIVGHSIWIQNFFKFIWEQKPMDPSCEILRNNKLKNNAMFKVQMRGNCSCMVAGGCFMDTSSPH